jgi:hypothetical protein
MSDVKSVDRGGHVNPENDEIPLTHGVVDWTEEEERKAKRK